MTTAEDLTPQPADWAEAGAYPVVPGVTRIPLPLAESPLRAVNVYVVQADDGLTLVDSGWTSPESERVLAGGLKELGHRLSDLRRIAVTHAHHDHFSQALTLRERIGVQVLLGRGERDSVRALRDGGEAAHVARLRSCGAPHLAEWFGRFAWELEIADPTPWADPDTWLDDGDRLDSVLGALDVTATPGHTRGHVVLGGHGAGVLFAGDHVLPHITPSIGYERVPEPAPLRSYLASLRLLAGRPDTLLLPAHGPVAPSVCRRVEELLAHHEQRLDDAMRVIAQGASTAYAVASGMTWTRRERPLPALALEHQALAVLEMEAHLQVLEQSGRAVRYEHDGVDHYRTSD